MGNRIVRSACCCALLIAYPAAAAAASVTLANGDVIEGTVSGRILISRMGTDGTAAIRMVEGRDIERIDASGVHNKGDSVMLVGLKNATTDDMLRALLWWNEGADLKKGKGLVRETAGTTVAGVRLDNSSLKPVRERLLGGYTINRERKEIALVTSIRLELPDGQVRTIPLSEIAGTQP